jgi:hypothetical protein
MAVKVEQDAATNRTIGAQWQYKLKPGICTDSLALETAKVCDIPDEVIQRATELDLSFDDYVGTGAKPMLAVEMAQNQTERDNERAGDRAAADAFEEKAKLASVKLMQKAGEIENLKRKMRFMEAKLKDAASNNNQPQMFRQRDSGMYKEQRKSLSAHEMNVTDTLRTVFPLLSGEDRIELIRFAARLRQRTHAIQRYLTIHPADNMYVCLYDCKISPYSIVLNLDKILIYCIELNVCCLDNVLRLPNERSRRKCDADVVDRESSKWRNHLSRFHQVFYKKNILTKKQWNRFMHIANDCYRPAYFEFFTQEHACAGTFTGEPCTHGPGNLPNKIDFLYATESERRKWILDHKIEVFEIARSICTQISHNETVDIRRAAHALLSLSPDPNFGEQNLYLRCARCDSTKRHHLTYGKI